MKKIFAAISVVCSLVALPTAAEPFFFNTGSPDGRMATASRPSTGGVQEIESADDFVVGSNTAISSATFTGLVSSASNVGQVRVEIYQVFPASSDTSRTSGPPTFSTSQVPTRVNSPSDVELADRDSTNGSLSFSAAVLNASFTAGNSVLNGIHPSPNQHTGGDGPVTGQEVLFAANFTTPLTLAPGHYFFVPQVQLLNGDVFYWLSAPRPITPPGTPFPVGNTDLQEWIRNDDLAPDWLRVGSDIVSGAAPPTFNAAFSVFGQPIPEPSAVVLLMVGLAGLGFRGQRLLGKLAV